MRIWALAVVLLIGTGGAVRSCAQNARVQVRRSFPVPVAIPAGVPNGTELRELSGKAQSGRPVTVSRVFARGEIAAFAQAQIQGKPVASQCDVKTRWEDGSLKHALISFKADLPANGTARVEFISADAPCHLGSAKDCEAAALTREGLLEYAGKSWDAAIETEAGGIRQSADLRAMIEAGAFRYWLKGPIVTQVIAEDRTPATRFDFGYQNAAMPAVATPQVKPSDTSFELTDAEPLAGLAMPTKIQIWAETLQVCGVQGNNVLVGVSACPAADGRGVDGTRVREFHRGDTARIPALENAERWHEIALASLAFHYSSGYAANLTSLPVGNTDLLAGLPLPFTIQVDDEQMSVCRIDGYTLRLGQSVSQCPAADGRGINGTRAALHLDGHGVYSPAFGSAWMAAGNSRYKSLHPIFVATFFNGLNAVKVDAMLENSWFSRTQDQHYTVALKSGPGLNQTAYQATVNHYSFARWRRTFWSGQEPPKVHVDPNFRYLIASRILPNWDLSYEVPAGAVRNTLERYARTSPDALLRTGMLFGNMGQAGGRGELGLLSSWDVMYLYTADPALLEVVLGTAIAAATAPIHFREDDRSRMYLAGSGSEAFGRPLSDEARQRFGALAMTSGDDALIPVGFSSTLARNYRTAGIPRTGSVWSPDLAHQPSVAFLPYLLTGDWFYLEELYFWTSYNIINSETGDCGWCRGPNGYINEAVAQTRGLAWAMRNLVHALFSAPDGTIEKEYLQRKLEANVAVREGVMGIRDGYFYDEAPASLWQWGRRVVAGGKANPLHFPHKQIGFLNTPSDAQRYCHTEKPWMVNYGIVVLAHLEELGYSVLGPLRQYTGRLLLNQILNPDFAPTALVKSYEIPVTAYVAGCAERRPFEDWKQVAEAFNDRDRLQAVADFSKGLTDVEHGYTTIALGSAGMLGGVSENGMTGEDAYARMKASVKNLQLFNTNPKWAFAPRTDAAAAAAFAARARKMHSK